MLATIVVLSAAGGLFYVLGGVPVLRLERNRTAGTTEAKINELTEYASRLRQTNKYLAAEKVYLQILKLDHKHGPTYGRLGSLYIELKNYPDAIECHQIAAQLNPSAVTQFNLGLSYFENRNYIKAVAAFEKSIMFQPSVPRLIGLAKAFQRLRDSARMISALEQAVAIEATPKTMGLLADAYRLDGRESEARALMARIAEIDPAGTSPMARPKQADNTITRVEKTPVK